MWINGLHICGIRCGQIDRTFCDSYEEKVRVATHPSNKPPSQLIQNYIRQLEADCARIMIHGNRIIVFPGCVTCWTVVVRYEIDPRLYPVPLGWPWDGR